MKKWSLAFLMFFGVLKVHAEVTLWNVSAAQIPGTKTVEITYDVLSSDTSEVSVWLLLNDGNTPVACPSVSGDVGPGVGTGTGKSMIWDMEVDWNGNLDTLTATLEVNVGDLPHGGDPGAESWEVVNDRWVKNVYADGAITMSDRDTGLMWVYDADEYFEEPYSDVVYLCENLVYAEHDDWFLPNINQLIVMSGQKGLFKDVKLAYYSSEVSEVDNNVAYAVDLRDGGTVLGRYIFNGGYAWPCRVGQSLAESETWKGNDIFSADSRDYTLEVDSYYGAPNPPVGILGNLCWGSTVTCNSGTDPTRICDGWWGNGSIPESGESDTTGEITLTQQNSYIRWVWDLKDSDGDGILDRWEEEHFGATRFCNPIKDADGDGQNNMDEYVAGTIPTDSESVFKASLMKEAGIVIRWNAVSGRVYSIYSTPSLSEAFKPVELDIESSHSSWTDPRDLGDKHYYKVKVELIE